MSIIPNVNIHLCIAYLTKDLNLIGDSFILINKRHLRIVTESVIARLWSRVVTRVFISRRTLYRQ